MGVDREWYSTHEFGFLSRENVFDVPVPGFFVAAPPMPSGPSELRDAPSDTFCADASNRVDRLESEILDLKARYWAARLKRGLSLAGLKINPGSTITNPSLKHNFYERMKYWYELDRVPELTPSELKRFVSIDGKAYTLYRECGV